MSVTEQDRPARRVPIPRKKKTARRPFGHAARRVAELGWPVALALAICLSAFAVDGWADRRSEGSPAANRALVDADRTAEVVADVSAKVARIFSYAHTDPAATERAARAVLTGRAAADYEKLFGQVKRQAPLMKLSLTTRVAKAGLINLSRDGKAVLIVFLDQTTTRAGKPAGAPVAAQLIVTAREDHGWRISDLRAA